MEASKQWLLNEFIGGNKTVFSIPVYQRNYDWSETHCNKLLDDIKKIHDRNHKHFIGTLLIMQTNKNSFRLQDFTIIDGQQRLTTVILFLKALADLAGELSLTDKKEEILSYLYNQHCDETYKVKLKPIMSDSIIFDLLLNNKFDEIEKNYSDSHIIKNYLVAKKRFASWFEEGLSIDQILEAMQQLEIVFIELTKGEDDPQVIFESINSTGLELSSTDLIRNFLLMDSTDQEVLFKDYWLPIENLLKEGTDYKNLNAFFSHYIVYKTGNIFNESKLYEGFVDLFNDQKFSAQSILKELKENSELFYSLLNGDDKYPETVNYCLLSIKSLKQTTCYPFLFHIVSDYKNSVINDDSFSNCMKLVLSYLVRRMICGVPSNSLRGFFSRLYERVFKISSNKNTYYESINKFMFDLTSKDVIPSDVEFKNALINSNIYRNIALTKFLLADIENGGNLKENIDFSSLTIEHLMPQTLNKNWSVSPEEHQQYLHVLGNLTITGYNSELSNKDFSEKKEIIKNYGKARILNSLILSADSWGIKEIKSRGESLSSAILSHFYIERVSAQDIKFDYTSSFTFDDDPSILLNRSPISFTFESSSYNVESFRNILMTVVKVLDEKDRSVLDKLAKENFKFSKGQKKSKISFNKSCMSSGEKARDDIYVETCLNSPSIAKFIQSLFECYGVDYSSFKIDLLEESENL